MYFKLLFCITLSISIFFSFRTTLMFESKIEIILVFILFQLIIWSILILTTNKKTKIIFYNFCFIILLNLISTPLFYNITFDVPVRQPNIKEIINYEGEFFKGMFSGKHVITTDDKGFRSNKKINYEKKPSNVFRIVTIGGSTTEQPATDDNKTWSNLLVDDLSRYTNRDIELINVGMSGLRAKHHYLSLKRVKKYKPDAIIFLFGINDWNSHIVNNEISFLIPSYEIKYDFKKSIIFKTFKNIGKQIARKLMNKKHKNNNNEILNQITGNRIEAYLLPQINSLKIRKIIKKYRPNKISQEYKFWVQSIINECKNKKYNCFFVDQPTGYKKNVSNKLKTRFWMTPPNQIYTLNLKDLIHISSMYNKWLSDEIIKNGLNFCLLSDKIEPNTHYFIDDCHFSENGSIKVAKIISECIKLNLISILN